MDIELLWFQGCPNHRVAEAMVRDVLAERGLDVPIHRIEVEDEATGNAVMFPGSPTIRVDGLDIEPGWEPCEDCTPRCRISSRVRACAVCQSESGLRERGRRHLELTDDSRPAPVDA